MAGQRTHRLSVMTAIGHAADWFGHARYRERVVISSFDYRGIGPESTQLVRAKADY